MFLSLLTGLFVNIGGNFGKIEQRIEARFPPLKLVALGETSLERTKNLVKRNESGQQMLSPKGRGNPNV